jgi:hypothetical protein
MYAWRHKETGQWLVLDQSRSHVKLSDTCHYSGDINQASVLMLPPIKERNSVEPVKVNVTRFVEIISDENCLKRNIKTLKDKGRKGEPFGISYVQRICGLGYNQARETIDKAIEDGVLVKTDECDWYYRFSS